MLGPPEICFVSFRAKGGPYIKYKLNFRSTTDFLIIINIYYGIESFYTFKNGTETELEHQKFEGNRKLYEIHTTDVIRYFYWTTTVIWSQW